MLLLALSVVALFGLCGLTLSLAVKRAPLGFEDAEGFHFGTEERSAISVGSPVAVSNIVRPAVIAEKRRFVKKPELAPAAF